MEKRKTCGTINSANRGGGGEGKGGEEGGGRGSSGCDPIQREGMLVPGMFLGNASTDGIRIMANSERCSDREEEE